MAGSSGRASLQAPVRITDGSWAASLAHGTPADRKAAEAWRAGLGDPPTLRVDPVTLRTCRDDEDSGTQLTGCVKTYVPDIRTGSPPSRWRAVLLVTKANGTLLLDFLAFGKGHPGSDLPPGQRHAHQRPSVYQLAHDALQRLS
ncbi:MAG: hypothetical protein F2825_00500 [Actinobacteria bacterium]|uniref:Unannotated protein n=1 Tax=freshwater metagenome TaxID=449393 RepID=A0A6J7FXU4_9ZZZZ|nr:hypothetical protein [Actinomycetota bacterium]